MTVQELKTMPEKESPVWDELSNLYDIYPEDMREAARYHEPLRMALTEYAGVRESVNLGRAASDEIIRARSRLNAALKAVNLN